MKKPAAGNLRWQRDGRNMYLYLKGTHDWPSLVGPVFLILILCTDNPWSRIFGSLLVGPGFGLNAIGLIRVTFWGLFSGLLLRLLFLLMSHEMLAIGQGTVIVRRQWLKWIFYYRRFGVRDIREIEIRELSESGFDGGTLRFHTATEAIPFGRTLAPAEARLTLQELARLGALPTELVAPSLADL
jgi:hypothetical protein